MSCPQNYLRLEERGVMLCDYFSGTPGVMLTVPVDNHTTCEQVVNELFHELSHLSDLVDSYFDQSRYDKMTLWEDLGTQMGYMKGFIEGREIADKSYAYGLDELDDSDDADTPVAIFTIELIDH